MIIYLALYYVLIPFGIILIAYKLWYDTGFLRTVKRMWNNGTLDNEVKKARRDVHKTIALFVIFLLIILPLWGFCSLHLTDHQIHREKIGVGITTHVLDPVIRSHGPTTDVDSVIEIMEEQPYWRSEEIVERIDFDELSRFPGQITIYLLRENRVIITYHYFALLPIVRAFGFHFEENFFTGELEEVNFRERVYMFPAYSGFAGDIANF